MSTTRCGFVAVMGAPNAGKSTLVNRLTGAKVSIVSPKAQTTRFRVLGIVVREAAQALFVDTPGIFAPKRRLDRAMVAAAWTGAADADLAMLVVDAKAGLSEEVAGIATRLGSGSRPVLLALNKVDLIDPQTLLPLTRALHALVPFSETFMVSAHTGDGCDVLLARVLGLLPEGPFLFPEDELSDLPQRMMAAEFVREQVFLQTHEEVPYSAHVETESWQERPDGSVRIEATIYVAREGQRAIVIGAGGEKLKAIGSRARVELGRALERTVHLFLNVKLRAKWDEEGARIRSLGLEDPQ